MLPSEKDTRDRTIRECLRLAEENRQLASSRANYAQRQKVIERESSLSQSYFDRLPRVQLSRCPFTGQPLVMAFDPWGVDGFWWQEVNIRKTVEPPAPASFCVLRGALDLCGQPSLGGEADAHVGPDVPYVIPRILNMPSMVMVVSSIPMDNGYRAYPLAYFSQQVPAIGSLVGPWREQTYSFKLANGEAAWSAPNDLWDFDLRPWVDAGKVLWIAPGDPQQAVQGGSWQAFPFKDLHGQRLQQTIIGKRLYTSPPPDGAPFEPFE